MLDKSTERILKRMDRMGFAGAGEALREIAQLRGVVAARDAEVAALKNSIPPLIADNERLRGLLADAPCTCPNSPPWDWPHDPHNEDCYLNRVRKALGE